VIGHSRIFFTFLRKFSPKNSQRIRDFCFVFGNPAIQTDSLRASPRPSDFGLNTTTHDIMSIVDPDQQRAA